MNKFWFLPAVLIGWSCAVMGPPGGGPEDKEPPTVTETFPPRDSVRVAPTAGIRIVFSEAMNRASVEKTVFLMPHPGRPPKLDWDKNTLTIGLSDPLEAERTFVVTVGTSASDVHGNSLARAYSFAFSTGDRIDAGAIGGTVVSDNKKNLSVWAYRMGEATSDSVIYERRADYITQADGDGRYRLPYLASGRYRVLAIADQDEDFLYSPALDFVGLVSRDIILSDSANSVTGMDIMLHREDTTAFALQFAQALHPQMIMARFNRPLRTERSIVDAFRLTDSLTGRTVRLHDAVWFNDETVSEVRLLCDPMTDGSKYVLSSKDLISVGGEVARAADVVFETIGPFEEPMATTEWVFPGTGTPVLPGDGLGFRWEYGVRRESFEKYFIVTDTADRKTDGRFEWTHSASVRFLPSGLWRPGSYAIRFSGDSVLDWLGHPVADSVIAFEFSPYPADTLGTLSGVASDEDLSETGPVLLIARALVKMRDYSVTLPKPGSFTIDGVIPGRYNLVAYRDRDSNGVYSYGRFAPVVFPERFASYPDTAVVRRNWETSNITIRFKK